MIFILVVNNFNPTFSYHLSKKKKYIPSKRDIKDSETMLGLSTIKTLGGGTQIFAGYHQGYSPISAGDAAASTTASTTAGQESGNIKNPLFSRLPEWRNW